MFAPALDMLMPGAGIVISGIATAAESVTSAARAVVPALPGPSSKKSLVALRIDIETALIKYGRRIVVVVDDLDRIAPADVAAMVQAVKAVADFPQIVYLLAYDADTLAQALRESLRVSDGRAYLEKIVQIAVPLPEIPARRFQPFAIKQIRNVLPAEDSICDSERDDLSLGLPMAAAPMQTPRDVLRLCTRLSLAAEQLHGKVNLADLVVVEAIALKVPDFLPWIKRHRLPHVTAGVEQHDIALQQRRPVVSSRGGLRVGPADRKAHEEQLDIELLALGSLTGDLRAAYQNAVDHLFDLSASKILAADTGGDRLRLRRFRHWYRWQCFTDHQELWEVAELQAMVSDVSVARPVLTSPEVIFEFCAQVCDLKDNLEKPDSLAWAEQFIIWDKSNFIKLRSEPDGPYGPFKALSVLLGSLDEQVRNAAWTALISKASLGMSINLLLRAHHAELPLSRGLLSQEARLSLNNDWFERLKKEIEPLCAGTSDEHQSALTFLSWAVRLQPIDTVRAATQSALDRSTCQLAKLFGSDWSSDANDHDAHRFFPWGILPDAHALALRVKNHEPDFRNSHALVWKLIESKVNEPPPAAAPEG
jgi:KAP family P-loop domain